MKKFPACLVFLMTIVNLPLTGTDPGMPVYDTLILLEGSKIIMPGGSHIKIHKDTTIIIHSQLPYKIRYPRGDAGEIFFDSLKNKANKNNWTRELHNVVITSPRVPDFTDTILTETSADPFLIYGGKFIRSIRYSKLEPFGPSMQDTARQAGSKFEKFGNDMHRITQDRVLKNHLLFRQGEILDPNEFADNERILRELPFIQDARIIVSESGSDSVDILIITKDNFSIGVDGALYDYDAGKISVFEKNLFGLGHELQLVFHWDGEKSPWMGNEVLYLMKNLGGSYIDTKLRYAHLFDSETYDIEFQRRFFTPNIKWAGALNLERTSALRYIDYIDTVDEVIPVKYNIYDLWAGRSFRLSSERRFYRNRINFVLATRVFRNHYIDRPEVSENSFYNFYNRNVWLTSFSVSSQSFYKSNLILDFGRTEDVPQGMLFSITGGPEFNEFDKRFYTGVSFSQGRYIGNFGYLYTKLEGGGFIKDNSFFQQGVINTEINYFTPLFIINRFKFRHFVTLRYIKGIHRFDDEFIGIDDLEGIRGFRSQLPLGQQKFIFNYEVDAFTPLYLYGFRFVFFGFADIAMIGPENIKWHDGKFFSGLGLGVRIRNERLVFPTISIRLGYYPNHPEKSFPLFVDVYGEQRLNPDYFYVTKPDVIGFK